MEDAESCDVRVHLLEGRSISVGFVALSSVSMGTCCVPGAGLKL